MIFLRTLFIYLYIHFFFLTSRVRRKFTRLWIYFVCEVDGACVINGGSCIDLLHSTAAPRSFLPGWHYYINLMEMTGWIGQRTIFSDCWRDVTLVMKMTAVFTSTIDGFTRFSLMARVCLLSWPLGVERAPLFALMSLLSVSSDFILSVCLSLDHYYVKYRKSSSYWHYSFSFSIR